MQYPERSNYSPNKPHNKIDNLQFFGSSEIRAPGAPTEAERYRVMALVTLAQSGDSEAVGALAARFSGAIFSYLLPLTRSADLATELTQCTMVKMMNCIWQIKAPLAFYSWIHTVAHIIHISHLRSTKNSRNNTEDAECALETKASSEPEPILNLETAETVELTRKVISSLNEQDREVLKLFYLDDSSLVDISQSLSCPAGTVKSRLFGARRRFKEKCEDLGLELV